MRAGVILRDGTQIAIIERFRAGHTYYVLPGGTVEAGESIEQTAVREAYEELGVNIRLGSLAAIVNFRQRKQYYFYATIIGGNFGSGTGAELASEPYSSRGSYRATWLTIDKFSNADIRPRVLVRPFLAGQLQPGQPLIEYNEIER